MFLNRKTAHPLVTIQKCFDNRRGFAAQKRSQVIGAPARPAEIEIKYCHLTIRRDMGITNSGISMTIAKLRRFHRQHCNARSDHVRHLLKKHPIAAALPIRAVTVEIRFRSIVRSVE